MHLSKHHGLGNDFLVALDEANPRALVIDGAIARRLCDRRRGIGADGLIHGAHPEPGSGLSVRMHLYNSDGGPAEMSGNGIRCLGQALALARGREELTVQIETDAGIHDVTVRRARDVGTADYVEATIGKARPGPEVPRSVVDRLAEPGPAHAHRYATVDVGNPHLVVAVDDPGAVALDEIGSWLEQQFPEGINVELVPRLSEVGRTEVDMRVWERGAGITQACGTGACAVAAVLHDWDAVGNGDDERILAVRMPGGEAQVTLQDDGMLRLAGPVHYVATVEVPDA